MPEPTTKELTIGDIRRDVDLQPRAQICEVAVAERAGSHLVTAET